MKTVWSFGVLAATLWCSGSAMATAVSDKAMTSVTVDEGAGKHGSNRTVHFRRDKVNINVASKSRLMTLDGVSAVVAEKIINYRGVHGAFRRASDLGKVDGVGRDVLKRNAAHITVK